MAEDKILIWEDYADEPAKRPGSIEQHREPTYEAYLSKIRGIYHDDPTLPPKPDTFTLSTPAFVNMGRWLVECLACGQAASPITPDEDYCCPVCGTWSEVVWPSNVAEIEAQLLALSGTRLAAPYRNWRP